MKETQEEATNIIGEEDRPIEVKNGGRGSWRVVQYNWWMKMALFTIFVLSGQSVATMLGRLYFNKGGNSKWMATLVQTAGFPLMLPLIFMYLPKTPPIQEQITTKPSWVTLFMLYMFLGVFLAADCMLYTVGLNFMPVSTYSLICASQLGFNAFFSYFLNRQKFTPFIANSLVLLSFSSTLLVFQSDSEQSEKTSKSKYVIGFVCTVAASAGYGLMLSTTQLAFQKILKSESYKVVFDMIVYQNLIASVVILVGLFASGEWNDIKGEMEGYKSGRVSYVMNLVWTAISWQVFSIGCIGLIFEVSSLFSNVISTLGIPIVPVLAVVFFHEKMNGVKIIAMLLAIWGFASYIYQHYLDDVKEKADSRIVNRELDVIETRNAKESKEVKSVNNQPVNHRLFMVHWHEKHKKWLPVIVYTVFVLLGQSVATLLGRLYFNKGGNSIWLLTLVQTVAFPVLLPFLLFAPTQTYKDDHAEKPRLLILVLVYTFLGVFLAAVCVLYSIGLLYLPVSTYSLICASQLGFNAVFAFFLNQQKLTPYVMNSVIILTLSTMLLVFQNDAGETSTSKGKYTFGFICTISASVGYALLLSLTQLSYQKVIKEETFRAVLAMIICQSLVSSFVIVIGLFASGDWQMLKAEMNKFELGEVLYVTIMVSKAISWQIFSIGTVGLTFKLSSLFSNVVSTVGLPIVPVLAVVFFHDDMNGVKMVSMVMAIWGFLSYMYQHYLDDTSHKIDLRNEDRHNAALIERV